VQALDTVAGEPLLYGRDDRHSPGNRGAVKQLAAVQPCQFFKRDAVFGNQLLVGGDYVPAGRQRLPDPFARGLQTTCELDHNVGLGRQNLIDVFGPKNG
jgi:hypothetical protein